MARYGQLPRVMILLAASVLPRGGRARPPDGERAHPPRRVACDATQAATPGSMAWPSTGACRISVHAAVASGSAGDRPECTTADLPGSAGDSSDRSSSVVPVDAVHAGSSRPYNPKTLFQRAAPAPQTHPRSSSSNRTPRWYGWGDRDTVTSPVPPFVKGTV
jgi:hypothetical protein